MLKWLKRLFRGSDSTETTKQIKFEAAPDRPKPAIPPKARKKTRTLSSQVPKAKRQTKPLVKAEKRRKRASDEDILGAALAADVIDDILDDEEYVRGVPGSLASEPERSYGGGWSSDDSSSSYDSDSGSDD